MCRKPKEKVFTYALIHARASLMQAKSMTPTTTTTAATAAAVTEGRRVYCVYSFEGEDERMNMQKGRSILGI